MTRASRRAVLAGLAVALARPLRAQTGRAPAVVVVGGGFGGASCARALHARGLAVSLVDASPAYYACPLSNAVLAGLRGIEAQRFTREALAREGMTLVRQEAVAADADRRRLLLADGGSLPWDRLVLAPGIALRFDALPGYDMPAASVMPHAWRAGEQTLLLRGQLEAMEDGGTVVMAVPANPYRCPPGPYERASLIAHYLQRHKPRSKLLVLDAKDNFSKQRLFEQAWAKLYPGIVEHVPLSSGGGVMRVEAATRTLVTEFGTHRATVANVIPPQRAGAIAAAAGVADRSGWCPIDPATFESRLVPRIHVIGDAAIAGAMPKSAFAANAQAKACAAAVAALLHGEAPAEPRLINTCYSLVAPDQAISVAGVYRPAGGLLAEIEGAGGISPLQAAPEFREREARYALDWFATITAEAFG